MRRWAEFVLHHRRWVISLWLLVMVIGAAAAGAVSDRLTVDFSLPGQPGTETAHKIKQAFGNGGDTSPYVVTVTMPAGKTITGNERAVAGVFDAVATKNPQLRVIDEANTGDKAFRTPKDDRTAYALVFFRFDPSPSATLPTTAIKAAAESAAPPGATIGVTGEDALAVGDSGGGGPGVLGETLLGGVGALAVLIFVFGSFLALLPLLVAAASILATFILLWPITYATDVSFIVQFLIALVGLGVAIDYSLLFVTRWREERDHGRENHDAVVIAMQTAGHAVVFSGVTVAIGLLALVVLPVPFMRSMGYGGALIPLASVVTTLSLTPAILGGIGPRIDWPKVRHENRASRAWSRWAAGVVRHRWVAAISALAVLGALVAVLFGVKIGQASSSSLASSGPAYDALQRLKDGGVSTGVLTPMEVLTKADQAAAARTKLEAVDGVDHAVLATGPAGTRDGQSVIVVLPHQETVNSKSVEVVNRVKHVAAGTAGVVGVAGLGAAQLDFLHAVYGNFPLMLTIIAVLTFLLLVRAFRSLLLPLKAVILNLVSLGAAYGIIVFIFQQGHGSQAIWNVPATQSIIPWIPLMIFAFLFGLSMDYEVFMITRMREAYDETGSTSKAIALGLARTGKLVTSAALVLMFAFFVLSTSPGTDIKQFGIGLAAGIIFDATIIRALLVPSLMKLMGRWNWWLPHWAARPLRTRASEPVTEAA